MAGGVHRLWARTKARLAIGLYPDRAFVRRVYRSLLGREPDAAELARHVDLLTAGRSRFDVMARVASEHLPPPTPQLREEELHPLLDRIYRRLFGRGVDPIGFDCFSKPLREGADALDVAFGLVESEEFVNRLLRKHTHLPSLRAKRPERYLTERTADGTTMDVYRVTGPEDLDWLEAQILGNGYYERPGIWTFGLDWDKRAMSEVLSGFRPRRALELGCSNGSVLKGLHDRGCHAEGVEISALALERAYPDVRERIHLGDVRTLSLGRNYDLVYGLDIFEHLNPNRLGEYIACLFDLLVDGGYLYTNVPAFGRDPVFGEYAGYHLPSWKEDADLGRAFALLPVDEEGYPFLGHLVVADWRWWTARFEEHGFVREPGIERAIHATYDPLFERNTPARRPLFVFSRSGDPARSAEIARGFREMTPLPPF